MHSIVSMITIKSYITDAAQRMILSIARIMMRRNINILNESAAKMRILDRFRGCLLASAAGDALCFEVEFMLEEDIFRKFGETGLTERHEQLREIS